MILFERPSVRQRYWRQELLTVANKNQWSRFALSSRLRFNLLELIAHPSVTLDFLAIARRDETSDLSRRWSIIATHPLTDCQLADCLKGKRRNISSHLCTLRLRLHVKRYISKTRRQHCYRRMWIIDTVLQIIYRAAQQPPTHVHMHVYARSMQWMIRLHVQS